MNLGALATIAVLNPPNLSILVIDNGHYGETGCQKSHTSLGVDLEKIAAASGIKRTAAVEQAADLAAGARLLREGNGTAFVRGKAERAAQVQTRPRSCPLPRKIAKLALIPPVCWLWECRSCLWGAARLNAKAALRPTASVRFKHALSLSAIQPEQDHAAPHRLPQLRL